MVDLPDISDLASVAPRGWQRLRRHLASIGVTSEGVAQSYALCTQFPEDQRDPIRNWHLRQRDDAAAAAMRLLMFGDAVTEAITAKALGTTFHEMLLGAGMLRVDAGEVRSVLRLGMIEDLCNVLADDVTAGGDVVMGVRETTVPLWRAVAPRARIARALDIGCGAGVIALLLSRQCGHVVATDINQRAVTLARVNAALNDIGHIDVREGDLFAPVSGETFDVIAAHPPYVALPETVQPVRLMHGGARGDEIACRLLSQMTAHLAPGGLAVVQAHWPMRANETLAVRLREVAGSEPDMLVLRLGVTSADDLATFWGHHDHVPVAAVRDHYARLDILATESCLCVLRRRDAPPAWTGTLDVPPISVPHITAGCIGSLLRSCELLHGADGALLAAQLRVPDGTSQVSVASADGTRTMLMLPPASLRQSVDLSPDGLRVIAAVSGAATVRASGQALDQVRQALASGALEAL